MAFAAREAGRPEGSGGGLSDYEEFEPDRRFNLAKERWWINADDGGLWGADAPAVMFDMVEAFERSALFRLVDEYLGEPAAISINKLMLRRVRPGTGKGNSLWHQDGAFLGSVRALNVWLSLSRCGDVAPGLDIVPKRIDEVVPTGTEGALFDWSVSQAIAEEAAGKADIARPIFEPGDMLLFDELCLHSTAADPAMQQSRYAIECWFFGQSAFPGDYAPLGI
jgi:hypothetical protein